MEVKSDLAYELAIAAASGASWNAELISSYNDALKALKDYWPGIENETPSKIGDGGSQVSCSHHHFC